MQVHDQNQIDSTNEEFQRWGWRISAVTVITTLACICYYQRNEIQDLKTEVKKAQKSNQSTDKETLEILKNELFRISEEVETIRNKIAKQNQ